MNIRVLPLSGVLAISALMAGCSAVTWKGATNFGVPQLVLSQAGPCNNKVAISAGKVDSSSQSDGWNFIDKRTNQLVRLSGDSIILDASEAQVASYTAAPTLAAAQLALLDLVQRDGTILPEPKACAR